MWDYLLAMLGGAALCAGWALVQLRASQDDPAAMAERKFGCFSCDGRCVGRCENEDRTDN